MSVRFGKMAVYVWCMTVVGASTTGAPPQSTKSLRQQPPQDGIPVERFETVLAPIGVPWDEPPYPPSDEFQGIEFAPATRRTLAQGSDIWPITWADDDHQYTAWGDGGGFGGSNNDGRVSLGVARIEGTADNYRPFNVWGGKNAETPATFTGKGTGIICTGGVLYMWVGGPNSLTAGETRLAMSPDHAGTWQLADWKWTIRDHLMAGSFLNAGRDNTAARDDYVYAYFTRMNEVRHQARNWIHEVPGRVDLARVPKTRILQREAYQWFAGFDDPNVPLWTANMDARKEVFTDRGGIKIVSACYQPQLGRYLFVYNPHDNRGNFALFEAPDPWGPWKTVAYLRGYEPFMPPGENTRVSVFHFAPKWWSTDGRQFTLVFNTGDDAWNTMRGRFLLRKNAL